MILHRRKSRSGPTAQKPIPLCDLYGSPHTVGGGAKVGLHAVRACPRLGFHRVGPCPQVGLHDHQVGLHAGRRCITTSTSPYIFIVRRRVDRVPHVAAADPADM